MKRLLTLPPVLFLALSANAVVNAGGDQFGPPPDDPGFNNVGTTVAPQPNNTCGTPGAGGVYMGNGWVLTAAHVGACNMKFNGAPYSWDGNNPVQFTYQGVTRDLILFRLVPPWPNQQDPTIHPLTRVISQTPPTDGSTVATLIGNGPGRGAGPTPVSCYGNGTCQAWAWKGESEKTWGHAKVVPTTGITPPIFISTFFDFHPVTDTANAATGDSGGGVFVKVNGIWMLAGIMDELGGCAVPSASVQGCQSTISLDLSVFRSQIVPYLPVDTDGAGVWLP